MTTNVSLARRFQLTCNDQKCGATVTVTINRIPPKLVCPGCQTEWEHVRGVLEKIACHAMGGGTPVLLGLID